MNDDELIRKAKEIGRLEEARRLRELEEMPEDEYRHLDLAKLVEELTPAGLVKFREIEAQRGYEKGFFARKRTEAVTASFKAASPAPAGVQARPTVRYADDQPVVLLPAVFLATGLVVLAFVARVIPVIWPDNAAPVQLVCASLALPVVYLLARVTRPWWEGMGDYVLGGLALIVAVVVWMTLGDNLAHAGRNLFNPLTDTVMVIDPARPVYVYPTAQGARWGVPMKDGKPLPGVRQVDTAGRYRVVANDGDVLQLAGNPPMWVDKRLVRRLREDERDVDAR